MGRDARRPRESLCWHCLINLAGRASDFLLSNPVEFFKFENRGEKEISEPCAGTGPHMELAAPFRVSKCRGFCLYSSVRQEAARVLPRLPLKTQGTRDRSLPESAPSPVPFPEGELWWQVGKAKSGDFLLQSLPMAILHSRGAKAAAGPARWLSR